MDSRHAADPAGLILAAGEARGDVLACRDGLSFWGGVDPESGRIIDAHHPNRGDCVAGKILLMPTSRGSCSGSGVLLALALAGRAPAALVFNAEEEILTLGALVADRIFGRRIPVLRLSRSGFGRLADAREATISGPKLVAQDLDIRLAQAADGRVRLTARDREIMDGAAGPAAALAMTIVRLMAVAQGAPGLTDVTRGHIDGCILAHSANLIFAEKMAELGARTTIPTTINAISVDRETWAADGVPRDFGRRASRLADAYVRMGARPTITCAPYLLDDPPEAGEAIGWSESNAVIYANSVLGARTAKHPDYLDLFIAMTGRAPATRVYEDEGRRPRRLIDLPAPTGAEDDGFWPLIGWLVGRLSPDRIPLVTGLEAAWPSPDDLKAFCAAFGATSGAPMVHIAGHTPEAELPPAADADRVAVGREDLVGAWSALNRGDVAVDLVAVGSPHASLPELERLAALFEDRGRKAEAAVIVTTSRAILTRARRSGAAARLERAGVRLLADTCWCAFAEPLKPPGTGAIMTNSGKYAHYAHGLCGRHVRFGGLSACVDAAIAGRADEAIPAWLRHPGGSSR